MNAARGMCLPGLTVAALALAACRFPESRFMRAGNAPWGDASAARVVFLRPNETDDSAVFPIHDETGAWIGDLPPASRFEVSVPGGRHTFFPLRHCEPGEESGPEVGIPVEAELLPRRIYFVQAAPYRTTVPNRSIVSTNGAHQTPSSNVGPTNAAVSPAYAAVTPGARAAPSAFSRNIAFTTRA